MGNPAGMVGGARDGGPLGLGVCLTDVTFEIMLLHNQ
jgi:hypothetical protein